MPDDLMSELEDQFAEDSVTATEETEETEEVEEVKETEQLEADSNEDSEETEDATDEEEAIAEVDGIRYTTKEIRDLEAGKLLRADYTRKTQKLAEDRRAFEEERESSGPSDALSNAERIAYDRWQRFDRLVMSDANLQTRFNEFVASIPTEQLQEAMSDIEDADEAETQLPKELREEINEWRTEREDQRIKSEMKEVINLVGSITADERLAFLTFVKDKQDKLQGILSLSDAVAMFAPFREKMLVKRLSAKEEVTTKRKASKSKTKLVGKGRKATKVSRRQSADDAMMADLEKILNKKR